jgi:uncharacterized protein YjiS (DUF1127 family)
MDLTYGNAVTRIELDRPLAVKSALGRRLTVVKGAAWITQHADAHDTVLEAGQDFVFDRPGSAWIQALGTPALVSLEDYQSAADRRDPLPARLWRRLGGWLQAARTRAQLHALSDRTLSDIGIRRTEIDCLVR